MPLIDYAAIRSQISMAQVLELLAFTPSRHRGPQLRGPCPLPDCSSPFPHCFSAHLQRNIYHCFSCGWGGNQLDLWAAFHNLSLHAAAHDLCRHVNLPPPYLPPRHHSPARHRMQSDRHATD